MQNRLKEMKKKHSFFEEKKTNNSYRNNCINLGSILRFNKRIENTLGTIARKKRYWF